MSITIESIRELLSESRYQELQHELMHEKAVPVQIKAMLNEIKKSQYMDGLIKIKIAILSSYTIQNINDALEFELLRHGFDAQIRYGQYNQYIQEMLDGKSFLYEFEPNIVLIAINTPTFLENVHINCLSMDKSEIRHTIESKLNYIYSAINAMNQRLKAKVLITNLDVPSYSPHGIRDANSEDGIRYLISGFNHELFRKLKPLGNVVIIDFEKVTSYIGKKHLTDHKYHYLGKFYLGREAIQAFCNETIKIIASAYGKSKKCLIVDLDNTLWGGVIGEDGPTGITLGGDGVGAVYKDVQKIILNYHMNGVLLAINSKNNKEDVMPVFEKNHNMVLQKDHFAIIKTNWKDKAGNIMEIAKELNIGLDSMVFLDDNPLERGLVKKMLPMVQVIDFPEDISELPEMLKHLQCFEFLELTEEDRKRNEMYAAQNKRVELQKNFENINDYLYDLKTIIEIRENSIKDIERIAQLINKTNQFNLCTNRYQKEDVESMMSSGKHHVFSMSVWDKFGELGLTGICIIKMEGDKAGKENQEYNISDFLMSCRIMSRGIEKEFARQCLLRLPSKGTIRARFIPTAKNEPVKGFYDSIGFRQASKDDKGCVEYEFDTANQEIGKTEWIEVRK